MDIKRETYDIIFKLYCTENLSPKSIGKLYNGASHHIVTKRIKELGIPIKSIKQALIGRKITWDLNVRKGIPRSEETKRKISKNRISKHIIPPTKGLSKANNPDKVKNGCPKEKHWNWKGGISNKSILLRQSSEYKVWRKACYGRDQYRCQHCFCHNNKLNVHHIIPFSVLLAENLPLFDINNGITLCKKCHKLEHDNKK